jgi:DNA repair protein RadA/Sms
LAPVILGSRVVCIEFQALVVDTYFPSPRRSTTGFELSRLFLILAVLEKRMKLPFSRSDVYLNVVGGLRISDPAADLAVAAALVSALTEKPVPLGTVFCGELGLTGELRPVASLEDRLRMAQQLGYQYWLGPPGTYSPSGSLKLSHFNEIHKALEFLA